MKKWFVLIEVMGGQFVHYVEAESEEDLKQQLCAIDVWNNVTKYYECEGVI